MVASVVGQKQKRCHQGHERRDHIYVNDGRLVSVMLLHVSSILLALYTQRRKRVRRLMSMMIEAYVLGE